jgi:hypothetical protein
MRDDEVSALICLLKRIMRQEHMTAQGMARGLGFSASHLSMIFARKRRPGIRFMRAVMARYPEVRRLFDAHSNGPTRTRRTNAPR